MPDPRALILAELVAQGANDQEADEWLRSGLRTWLRSGCSVGLQTVLRLPATARAAARARRDFWVRTAAEAIGEGPCTWERARRVLRAAARLSAGLRTNEPAEVDAALLRALDAGAPMPDTDQGIHRIIR